ncbi:BUD13 homolog isoform X2 [Drosophila innubila]|uniref:BUD13 homolog isoform X2 n=1 Tax=Drosophila innubila TaxID=198719 RepID=UPI00148DC29A|nr:BUD13 homolog isoform X2 [Drosophila innubila]
MSTQNAKIINQKEYLKKYLSGDKEKKKKKKHKKHKKSTQATVKIIDDDAYDSNIEEMDEDLLLGGEDAPQIVGEYIEENPNAVRSKWRNIAVKEPKSESDTETNGQQQNESDLWGRKASTVKIKQESSPSPSRKRRNTHSPAVQIKKEKRSSSCDQSPPAIKIKQEKRSSSRDQSPARIHGMRNDSSAELKGRNSDQSPPRRMRDGDQSPPRRRRDEDQSPPRRRRNSDQSPPRRRREEDQSPPRRQRDSDQSPPRRRRDKDQSSPKRRRNSDQSPPRRRREEDQSPPRRQRDSDQSPPRRRRDKDQSPPRRRRNSDQSPPRRRREEDQSPPRRQRDFPRDRRQPTSPRRQRARDQSPPQRIKKESPANERKSRWSKARSSRTPSPSPPPTHKPKTMHTLDGKKAGLQDAKSLKSETDKRRREEHQMFDQMSSEVSGRDADVKVRSTGRRGRRARDAAAEDPEEQKRKEAHEQKKKQLYDRWGKGLKQLEDQQARHAEMTHEAAKPVARYANDEDLDRHLREQEHADDPMLQYMQEKRKKREQQSNKPVMPVYVGSYPENRYGIRPGYRWDGVDRSNGYEQRWFNKLNERRAVQDEAYKYSVEDM